MRNILILILVVNSGFISVAQIYTDKVDQHWIEVGSNDPYNGIEISHIDTLKFRNTIQFCKDGLYFEKDNWNNYQGRWEWNNDTTKIGVVYLKINNEKFPHRPITDFHLIIYKVNNDSLIIGQQGRHGISKSYYILTSDSNMELNCY